MQVVAINSDSQDCWATYQCEDGHKRSMMCDCPDEIYIDEDSEFHKESEEQ
jgi:hypothetical protein